MTIPICPRTPARPAGGHQQQCLCLTYWPPAFLCAQLRNWCFVYHFCHLSDIPGTQGQPLFPPPIPTDESHNSSLRRTLTSVCLAGEYRKIYPYRNNQAYNLVLRINVIYSPLWMTLLWWEVKISDEGEKILPFLTRKKKTLQNAIREQDREAKQGHTNSGPAENVLILYTVCTLILKEMMESLQVSATHKRESKASQDWRASRNLRNHPVYPSLYRNP